MGGSLVSGCGCRRNCRLSAVIMLACIAYILCMVVLYLYYACMYYNI